LQRELADDIWDVVAIILEMIVLMFGEERWWPEAQSTTIFDGCREGYGGGVVGPVVEILQMSSTAHIRQ